MPLDIERRPDSESNDRMRVEILEKEYAANQKADKVMDAALLLKYNQAVLLEGGYKEYKSAKAYYKTEAIESNQRIAAWLGHFTYGKNKLYLQLEQKTTDGWQVTDSGPYIRAEFDPYITTYPSHQADYLDTDQRLQRACDLEETVDMMAQATEEQLGCGLDEAIDQRLSGAHI